MKARNAITEFLTRVAETLNRPHDTALSLVSELTQAAVSSLSTLDRDNPKVEDKLRAHIAECLRIRQANVQAQLAHDPAADVAAEAVRLRQLACVLSVTKDASALFYLAGNLEAHDGRFDYLPNEASSLDDCPSEDDSLDNDDQAADIEGDIVDRLLGNIRLNLERETSERAVVLGSRCWPPGDDKRIRPAAVMVALTPNESVAFEHTKGGWQHLQLPRPDACPAGHTIFITAPNGETTQRLPTDDEFLERLATEQREQQLRLCIVENHGHRPTDSGPSTRTVMATILVPHPETLARGATLRIPVNFPGNDYNGRIILHGAHDPSGELQPAIAAEFHTSPPAVLWPNGGGRPHIFKGTTSLEVGDVVQVGRFDLYVEAVTQAAT